jgi:hypothetical protein
LINEQGWEALICASRYFDLQAYSFSIHPANRGSSLAADGERFLYQAIDNTLESSLSCLPAPAGGLYYFYFLI